MFVQKYNASTIKNVLNVYNETRSFRKTAIICNVSKTSAHRWWTKFHNLLNRPRMQKKTYKPRTRKYPKLLNELKDIFETSTLNFRTLKSIQNTLKTTYNTSPSVTWIHYSLKKVKSLKKEVQSTFCVYQQS